MEDGVLGRQMTGPSEPPRRGLSVDRKGGLALAVPQAYSTTGIFIFLSSGVWRMQVEHGVEAARATLTTAQASFFELESFGFVLIVSWR